jgi:hypothetical protein
MRYRLRTLLILMAIVQIVVTIAVAEFRVSPMATVGCYIVLLLGMVVSMRLPDESSQPLFRMIAIFAVGLAVTAVLIQLVIGH